MAVDACLKEKLEQYADEHLEELVENLMALMRINSVRTPARVGAPFGMGPKTALDMASRLCEENGFPVTDYDSYVRCADLNAGAEPAFDILGHVDVVPAGDGWTVTGPFVPRRIEDKIYGRGGADDKGGVMAALYAMKAVKELGIPVSKRCRLIIGSGEETGMEDVHYYYAKEKEAPMTATPDAEYPVTNGEKGRLLAVYDATFAPSKGERKLLLLASGIAVNQVPASAVGCVMGITEEELKKAEEAVSERTGVEFTHDAMGGTFVIRAAGKCAHGSTPGLGLNSVQGLCELVLSLGLDECEGLKKLAAYTKLYPFGEYDGTSQGMAAQDEVSGKTSCAPDILRMTECSFHGEVDYRTSICADKVDMTGILTGKANEAGLKVRFPEVILSHYVPGDSLFVKTLNECYEAVSGKEGAALCMGGNSYVHDTKGGVCFGYVTNNSAAGIHGPNEYITLKDLRDTIVIYGLAIAKLCR